MLENVDNYIEQGGARSVIGGALDFTGAGVFKKAGVTMEFPGPALLGNVAVAADALAIPLTASHVSKTTGADAEALTLADGAAGQILTLTLTTDGGGTGTLTPATKTGFATIVFADAGDTATLKFIDATVGWILMGASGVAAPPLITV